MISCAITDNSCGGVFYRWVGLREWWVWLDWIMETGLVSTSEVTRTKDHPFLRQKASPTPTTGETKKVHEHWVSVS